jgi:hypothetical protein
VEGSKFCLFSVVLPARCVSSISPRFHYRRHAFCFLPLSTILESPDLNLNDILHINRILKIQKFMQKHKTPQITKANPDQKEQWWRYHNTRLKIILWSHCNKNGIVMVQKQTCRPKEKNRRPRNKLIKL